MLIYNTTYQVDTDEARNFMIYLHEVHVPAIVASGLLRNPRLRRILSHQDGATECYALEFETEDSQTLHEWYGADGARLNADLTRAFGDKVTGFPTLMEEIE